MWGVVRNWSKHFRSEWIALLVSGFVIGYPLNRGATWLAEREIDPESEPLFDYQLWADRISSAYTLVIVAGIIVAVAGLAYATVIYRRCEEGSHCKPCADRSIEVGGRVQAWTP